MKTEEINKYRESDEWHGWLKEVERRRKEKEAKEAKEAKRERSCKRTDR